MSGSASAYSPFSMRYVSTLVSGLLAATACKASIDCSFGRLKGVHDLNFGGEGVPESLSNLLGAGLRLRPAEPGAGRAELPVAEFEALLLASMPCSRA